MKVKRIQTTNHHFFGDIDISFCDGNGSPIDTIILIGENGAGKSMLLNLIYSMIGFNLDQSKRDEQRSVELLLTDKEVQGLAENENLNPHFKDGIENTITVNIDYNIVGNWNQVRIHAKNRMGKSETIASNLLVNATGWRCIYSDVEINFSPGEIRSVTAGDIDQKATGNIRSSKNLATEVTQLLIDITNLDALEFSSWGRKNVGGPVDADKLDTRMSRFKEAFSYMFPNKQFLDVVNIDNKKVVQFSENGKAIPITALSSGEKQIVFRGSFLLRNREADKGAIILIDEPEISLHPRWQLKILNFYKKLFTGSDGIQTSQLFVSTHSPFIIHNGNRLNDRIIILERKNEKTTVSEEGKFFGWTSEEIIQSALSIGPFTSTARPVVFVEGETDEKYFTKTIEVYSHTNPVDIRWIGRIAENGQREFTGDSALDQTKSFILANEDLIKHKVVLLYDSDTKAVEKDLRKVLVRKAPKNSHNTLYKRGIENLLILPADFKKEPFYTTTTKVDEYGATKTIQELDKTKLCGWVLAQQKESQKSILKNVSDLFLKVSKDLGV